MNSFFDFWSICQWSIAGDRMLEASIWVRWAVSSSRESCPVTHTSVRYSCSPRWRWCFLGYLSWAKGFDPWDPSLWRIIVMARAPQSDQRREKRVGQSISKGLPEKCRLCWTTALAKLWYEWNCWIMLSELCFLWFLSWQSSKWCGLPEETHWWEECRWIVRSDKCHPNCPEREGPFCPHTWKEERD